MNPATNPYYVEENLLYAPSAPPPNHLDPIPGYENTAFNDGVPVLPPPQAKYEPPSPIAQHAINLPQISEEDARTCLLDYANGECCYGSKVPVEMVIYRIQNSSAFYYKLETFAEARKTAWKYTQYEGEPLMTYGNVAVPGPWEITVATPAPFNNSETNIIVPGTSVIKICFECNGGGFVNCETCLGQAWKLCVFCEGSGRSAIAEKCSSCNGRGKKRCSTCNATGAVQCDACNGLKQLKHYIELTVTWHTYVDDHIVEETDLPDYLIRHVDGIPVFHQELPMVQAVTQFPNEDVVKGASDALQKRLVETSQTERILMQRQVVSVVPVSEVRYSWKNKENVFYIYGNERKVYAADYPQSCCWGCTVL